MKVKNYLLIVFIMFAAATMGLTAGVTAQAKVVTIKAEKKSQIEKATEKAIKCYDNTIAYMVTGKYAKKVNKGVIKKIKEENNLCWVNEPITSSRKSLKEYKNEVMYLGKIVEEVRQTTEKSKEENSDYFRIAKMTDSEVNADVLESYTTSHMEYVAPTLDCYFVGDYEKVYNSNYSGDCGSSRAVVGNITKALGYKIRYFETTDHGWVCMEVVDMDGTKYWRGVAGSSGAENLTRKSKWENQTYYWDKVATPEEIFEELLGVDVGGQEVIHNGCEMTVSNGTTLSIPTFNGKMTIETYDRSEDELRIIENADGSRTIVIDQVEKAWWKDDTEIEVAVQISLNYNEYYAPREDNQVPHFRGAETRAVHLVLWVQ